MTDGKSLEDKSRKRDISNPMVELSEDENNFYVKEESEGNIVYVNKKDRLVTLYSPMKGVILPESMRGFYLSELSETIELFIHFVSKGEVDRLWNIGEIDSSYTKNARDWTRKVNGLYKQ